MKKEILDLRARVEALEARLDDVDGRLSSVE